MGAAVIDSHDVLTMAGTLQARRAELLAKEEALKKTAAAAALQAAEVQGQLKSNKRQLHKAQKHAQECRATLAAAQVCAHARFPDVCCIT